MFSQPHSIEEALELKKQHGSDAAFLAGGTDIIVMMNHGRVPAKHFVDLGWVPGLDRLETPAEGSSNGGYSAGGGVTFATLGKLPVRALADAALSVGGPQIRNRGTIAGNLATASPAGDGSTALLALDALVTLRNKAGTRKLPLREFFLDYKKLAMAPDEMIDQVEFATPVASAWQKLGKRGAMNISVVCCAVSVARDGKFGVAFGSVGPYPLWCPETGKVLTEALAAAGGIDKSTGENATTGITLPNDAIEAACTTAAREVRPIDDFRAGADYRRAMSAALLRKALRNLLR